MTWEDVEAIIDALARLAGMTREEIVRRLVAGTAVILKPEAYEKLEEFMKEHRIKDHSDAIIFLVEYYRFKSGQGS